MTDCTQEALSFPRCKGRRVEARFSGGAITSNGGAVVVRNIRRIRFLLSSTHPYQDLFVLAGARLAPG